jgi:hypothetical protein
MQFNLARPRREALASRWVSPHGDDVMSKYDAGSAQSQATGVSLWGGRALIYLVVLLLLLDGVLQIVRPPFLIEAMRHTGYDPADGPLLAAITLTSAILLAIPATSVLGAILVTGFLGGAIAAHVRIGEIGVPPQLICLALGVASWGGLYLSDPRLRALIPLRES